MTQPPLPDLFDGHVDAVIFDLDGVITDTASVHSTAWKQLFDDELRRRAEADGTEFVPFEEADYLAHVDGKPRYDGVRTFLESRGISLPEGTPEDPPDAETIAGLGNRKNELFRAVLAADGAQVFPTSVELIERLRAAGIATGLVSSSRNARFVLGGVELLDRFDDILDGDDRAERGLAGKPAPDTYLDCARRLGVEPARAAMVEDAISGVESGAAGAFVDVIGVDRGAGRQALLDHGATVVVSDLGELLAPRP
ncbi:MAG: beta-phosphoglucomutase family hydrolase [Actinomycetota bacterium]